MNSRLQLLLRFGILCVLLFLQSASCVFAESLSEFDTRIEAVDQYAEQALYKLGVPGASLALVHEGEIVYKRSWGMTGGEKHEVTEQTPFLIGSISKPVTAYAVMHLVQEGEISLDDLVQRHLPSFTLQDEEAAARITIKQLLTHESGISTATGFKYSDYNKSGSEAIAETVRELAKESVSVPPGEHYQYSAANYVVLGALIEEVSGMSFSEYMEQNIFQRLGMEQAAATRKTAVEKGWNPGYRSWFGVSIASRSVYDDSGAPYGYISASAEDMAHFLTALQEPGTVLSAEKTRKLMEPVVQTNATASYGLGWRIKKLYEREPYVWHGGSTSDFRSEIFMLPESDWGAVLLTNRNNALEDAHLTVVTEGIAGILLGEAPEEPVFPMVKERWMMAVFVFLLAALTVLVVVKRYRGKTKTGSRWGWAALAFLFMLSAVALIPLFVLSVGLSWRSLRLFVPDLALLVTVAVALLAVNCLLAGGMFLRRDPEKKIDEI